MSVAIAEPAVMNIALADLVVDPKKGSPRATPVDEAMLDALVAAITEGETLPPLAVCRTATPDDEPFACPAHWRQADRAKWAAQARNEPFVNAPLQGNFVLYDGLTRYWAMRAAGVDRCDVVVHDSVVAGWDEVLALAVRANLRNARRLTDTDLRGAFCNLWLGRPLKDAYERFTPADDAPALADIGRLLGKSQSWCYDMVAYNKVFYATRVDLGLRRSLAIAKLDPEQWERFCLTSDGELRVHFLVNAAGQPTGGMKTVADMSSKELELVIALALRQEEMVPAAAEDDAGEGCEATPPESEPTGQFVMDFELDWDAPAVVNIRRLADCAAQLAPKQAYDQAIAMSPLVSETLRAYKALQERAATGGYRLHT
jgi:hypothetical protein